jgi:hypothetical protein
VPTAAQERPRRTGANGKIAAKRARGQLSHCCNGAATTSPPPRVPLRGVAAVCMSGLSS